ncbi:MAG: sulfite exporter TauE/SafE family protein [Luteolibacter sp.]|uniref:sulfite exporter TauE/SafE family protein n=1 Tax=Luteolibacter sp. TaxID=1962973 RepID=UPI0032635B4C
MTITEILSLLGAATAAGAINAVAGGGTILTFPTLLAIGTPAVVANATSTLALVIGTGGSVYGFRRYIAEIRVWLWRFVPVSLLGGLIGSWLLTRSSNETFSRLVPFLILFATLLFMAQGLVSRLLKRSSTAPKREPLIWPAVFFQFLVSIYGGYFGAGIGILMLATLGFIGLKDIHQMNALKNILGSLINVVAAIMFIAGGLIDWPKAGVMTVGAVIGYFLGSHYSQKIPQLWVRRIVLGVGFGISAITFYRRFHS